MTSDEYLQAVTIGEREPLRGSVELVEYDPEWPVLFERRAELIRRALGDRARRVEHAGSTSVPGLCAKPILDIVLAVPDAIDEVAYVPALERSGYVLRIREPDWYEHRLLKRGEPAVNLHVFSEGCAEIERMLAFRDRLRENDADRDLYAQVKRKLAAQTWEHTQHYADAKTEVVEQILERARRR